MADTPVANIGGEDGIGIPAGTTNGATLRYNGVAVSWEEVTTLLIEDDGSVLQKGTITSERTDIQGVVTTRRVNSATNIGAGEILGVFNIQTTQPTAGNFNVMQLRATAEEEHTDLVRGSSVTLRQSLLGRNDLLDVMKIESDGHIGGLFLKNGAQSTNHKFEVVSALPGTPDPDTIYFVTG